MGGQGGARARQGQVGYPDPPNLPTRTRRHGPQSSIGGFAGQIIHKGLSAQRKALERACATQCGQNAAPDPRQRLLNSRPALASRRAQAQEAQMLDVEEHCWSLAEREARPHQNRSDQLRRSSQATALWKPINSQRQWNPVGSGQNERRQCLSAIRIHPSQGHVERMSQGLKGAHGPRNETPSRQQAGLGNDHDQHSLAPI
ncbi:unnamed protein product [Sphagnum tenellum]